MNAFVFLVALLAALPYFARSQTVGFFCSPENTCYGMEVCVSFSCTCSAGYHDTDGDRTCDECAAGKYKSSTGTGACTNCEKGKIAATIGLSTCSDCSPGTYASTVGLSTCTSCSPGTVTYYITLYVQLLLFAIIR